tara:strand:+ start:306 stop:713 length:408 start_codon:yes stop_codon:yes gene_type:complete
MYKFLKKINSNLYLFLILILFLIICKSTDTFKKFYNIAKEDINTRQQNAYDFCDYTGNGYIFHIKKKFNIKKTPIIKNNFRVPNQNWIFYNLDDETDKNKLILLNQTDEKKIKSNLNKFKIVDSFQNRCFFLEKL